MHPCTAMPGMACGVVHSFHGSGGTFSCQACHEAAWRPLLGQFAPGTACGQHSRLAHEPRGVHQTCGVRQVPGSLLTCICLRSLAASVYAGTCFCMQRTPYRMYNHAWPYGLCCLGLPRVPECVCAQPYGAVCILQSMLPFGLDDSTTSPLLTAAMLCQLITAVS